MPMRDSNYLIENNARYNWHPMAHPAEGSSNPPPIIVGGSGVRITDLSGNQFIDAVGGLWNVNLGYSCHPVKDAIAAQLQKLPYYSTFRGSTNDKVIELSQILTDFFSDEGMARAFFTSGGSDSVETALRLARQYHKIRGDSARVKFISLVNGYHGTHFGAASVNGNPRFRAMYEPLLPECFHIPSPYTYRNPFGEEDSEKLAGLCIAALESTIAFQGAGTVAAFIMEPIPGAGGVIVPHRSFMPKVREICDKNGILLISDEVITGFGRAGNWSGSRLWGVKPDMMTIAKAITNGYFPFGAALLSERVAEVFENERDGAGWIGHGYTYTGHPVGAAAAIACINETVRLNVPDNAAVRGRELHTGLQRLKDKHEIVGDVRGGKGLMLAMELVSDRYAKIPLGKDQMDRIHDAILKAGVMVRVSGSNIILSPPLVISSSEAEAILAAVDEGLSTI